MGRPLGLLEQQRQGEEPETRAGSEQVEAEAPGPDESHSSAPHVDEYTSSEKRGTGERCNRGVAHGAGR